MSAQNLSHLQFIDVARGIHSDRPGEPLGKHWSSDEYVAQIFGEHAQRDGRGHVFYGRVHPDSVVTPGTKEHDRYIENYAIHGPESIEQEVTVRPGSTVHVTGRSTRTPERDRMRIYNPPREMKA